MKMIFLGPPGAGKGTQAERICDLHKMAHISTGDMLRAQIRSGSELGKAAQGYMDRGELVPDELLIDMVKVRITEPDCKNGYLLDGFPRTIAQADALATFEDIDMVVNIDVPFERLVDRISGRRMCPDCGAAYHISSYAEPTCAKCGGTLYQRDDDKAETVLNRLKVYQEKTQPLIDYYEEKGKLKNVNGDQAIEAVLAEISKLMES